MDRNQVRLADVYGPSADQRLAQDLVALLGGRAVLTDPPSREDPEPCRLSIGDVKKAATATLLSADPDGEFALSLGRIQAACNSFNTAAGSYSKNFDRNGARDLALFHFHLEAFRRVMGQELAWLSRAFSIRLRPELQDLLPTP